MMPDDYSDDKLKSDEKPKNVAPRGISPILVIFLISGVLGLIAAGAMLFAEGSGTSTDDNVLVPRTNWEAPDFVATDLDGEVVSLDDYRGRVVFLNFWRTDCGPCVHELPAFQTFTQEQGEDGALIIALNQGESPEQISEFLNDIEITNLTVWVDEAGVIRDDYRLVGFPSTFVIDEAGMVQFFKLGPLTVDEMYLYLESMAPVEADIGVEG